jgi:predicted nucleic acid-binding protein
VIVVDTSAWIEWLRATGSDVHLHLRTLLKRRAALAVTELVVAEVLAGVPGGAVHATRAHLLRFRLLRLHGLSDFEAAAALYRICRDAGEPVRQLSDCLVAVPVIAAGARLLHADRDFDTLARHTPLEIEEPLAA